MDEMKDAPRAAVPGWFWIVAALLTLWSAFGCYACVMQWRLGADAIPDPTDYDRALFAILPAWYMWVYTIAVVAGLLGGIGLLARSRWAQMLFLISLVAVLAQFGWLFATTDIIAVKGAAEVVPFPVVITLIAAFAVWFSGSAAQRGWLR